MAEDGEDAALVSGFKFLSHGLVDERTAGKWRVRAIFQGLNSRSVCTRRAAWHAPLLWMSALPAVLRPFAGTINALPHQEHELVAPHSYQFIGDGMVITRMLAIHDSSSIPLTSRRQVKQKGV